MAIFIYDDDKRKWVETKKPPIRIEDNINTYINMRKTWSNQTKMEFNTTPVGDSVRKMGGDI